MRDVGITKVLRSWQQDVLYFLLSPIRCSLNNEQRLDSSHNANLRAASEFSGKSVSDYGKSSVSD
jgi:hypothetical protein